MVYFGRPSIHGKRYKGPIEDGPWVNDFHFKMRVAKEEKMLKREEKEKKRAAALVLAKKRRRMLAREKCGSYVFIVILFLHRSCVALASTALAPCGASLMHM